MGYLFILVVGAVSGWLTTFLSDRVHMQTLSRNVMIGIGGALLAGFVVGPALVGGDLAHGNYTVALLVVSSIGAICVPIVANLLQSRHMR